MAVSIHFVFISISVLTELVISSSSSSSPSSPPRVEPWQKSLMLENYLQDSPATGGQSRFSWGKHFDPSECSLSSQLKAEIQSYQPVVDQIIDASTEGQFRGKTFNDLAEFVDKFGPRVSGSEALEKSITYLGEMMTEAGMVDVHDEEAVVPKWIRGNESAMMLTPRPSSLSIRGLGFSVPTSDEGITAEVEVIRSFKEMANKKDTLAGKIVVYNSKTSEGMWLCIFGASMAAKFGAVATLARSATWFSLYSVHASVQFYDETVPKIPVATLTLEDADMIDRMSSRGDKVTIHLTMTNLENTETTSRNVIGDYTGRELADEYVMLAGHSDSWDSGEGVLDDGIGPILALETVRLLKQLELHPRRTIRNVFFTGEEAGLFGAKRYTEDHKDDFKKYSAALEADYGCLQASGLLFSGTPEATCIMYEIMQLYVSRTNASSLIRVRGVPTDIYLMNKAGVPGVVLNGDDGRYIWYHHTEADAMTALEPNELDNCLAVWASTAYVIADLEEKLPREQNTRD